MNPEAIWLGCESDCSLARPVTTLSERPLIDLRLLAPTPYLHMLRLAADENFNNDIVRALKRRKPELDIVRVQDAGLGEAE